MISETLASILRSGRQEFNRQFAEARRLRPDLDAASFRNFLGSTVDGLIHACGRLGGVELGGVVMAAYEIGLELVAQKLAGTGARNHGIEEGWRRVLFPIVPLWANAPGLALGAVSNALHNLAVTPGARPEEWVVALERFGPKCKDCDALLRLGQVAAWKAGLAHFRKGAIASADALPEQIVLGLLNAPESSTWPEVRKRLLANPWFDPAKSLQQGKNGRFIFVQAGAFRGFGGLFIEPPRVTGGGEHFFVRSGEECWLLTADLYGATFHRATMTEFDSAGNRLPPELRIDGEQIVWNNQPLQMTCIGKRTSVAANPTTLAFTTEWAHAVTLVALG